MSPIFSFICPLCNLEWDDIVGSHVTSQECQCGGIADKKVTTFGRYMGDTGGASTTPLNTNKPIGKLNFRKEKK